MENAWKSGDDETRPFNYLLASNCFGDYYTRKNLSLKERELITFCFIYSQGGCEPQLLGHARGNFRMGNDKAFLSKILLFCLPYIGYPRTLNALTVISQAWTSYQKEEKSK